jgi:hypothetical protein
MAVQPPFRSDAFEVENADAVPGPRLLEAYIPDGSLRFTDTRIPGGINLSELAGLQQAQNTIIVSPAGAGGSKDANGDPITTVQGGLDAVPTSADVDDPWVVVVAPGLYVEDVYFLRDGVTLEGLGTAILRNASAVSTLRMRAGPNSTPRRVAIKNLRIENVTAGEACIDISSATFATGTLTIASVPNIGDVADVNGTTLTAIANGSVPAAGEFELGTDTATTAVNLGVAINDPVNGLVATVVATVVGSVITIRALDDGVAGNAITLSSTVPLVIVASGATLTGGTAASTGSTVGDDLIQVIDCDLIPTVATGFQFRAAAVNNMYISGGNWNDGATGTTVSVLDCAAFEMNNVFCALLVLNYDDTNPEIPVITTSAYAMNGVRALSSLTTGYVGVGSLTMSNCTVLGPTVYSGDAPAQSFTARRSAFGPITVGGVAPAMVLSDCTRGTLTGAGTGTLAETTFYGSAVFAAVPVVTIPFDEPQPDLAYTVLLEPEGPPAAITDIPSVPSFAKTVAGFDIAFGAPQALTINFVVKRDI